MSHQELQTGLIRGYNDRDFAAGPSTYTDSAFLRSIYEVTGIQEANSQLMIADLMSGPGKLGLGMKELAKGNELNHHFFFLDLALNQLQQIMPSDTSIRVGADARMLPIENGSLDVVTARYSIKDLPPNDQVTALREIRRVLRPGGTLVIADMVAFPDTKEWLNKQHSLKQELGGRNPKFEGKCHIPTAEEWLSIVEQSGLKPTIRPFTESSPYYYSRVTTKSWLTGKQFSGSDEEQRKKLLKMNRFILSAPKEIVSAFNIRQEQNAGEEIVKIDYPVVLIQAVCQ
ncbi:class I SAM-dependent methyltransferase [Candidatus Woesebacteria bacterium]|nr:class I SAM-dependent methyltransferase [Candidatus Woesebacteria bacterium]